MTDKPADPELWRAALICRDWETCSHPHHVKRAKARWAEAMKADTLVGAATVLHYRCDYWNDTSLPIANREGYCGPNAERHIAHYAGLPWLVDAYTTHPERTTP